MADITAVTMFKGIDGDVYESIEEAHEANTRSMLESLLGTYATEIVDLRPEIDPVDFIMEHAEQILAILSRPVAAP